MKMMIANMKDFDLFKVMAILTIIGISIAGIASIDFTGAASADDIGKLLSAPLELKVWHYILLIVLICNNKR